MTAAEAVERQAAHENLIASLIRPGTAEKIVDVLQRAQDVVKLDFSDIESWRKLGALKADAAWALSLLQADQRLFKEFGGAL